MVYICHTIQSAVRELRPTSAFYSVTNGRRSTGLHEILAQRVAGVACAYLFVVTIPGINISMKTPSSNSFEYNLSQRCITTDVERHKSFEGRGAGGGPRLSTLPFLDSLFYATELSARQCLDLTVLRLMAMGGLFFKTVQICSDTVPSLEGFNFRLSGLMVRT